MIDHNTVAHDFTIGKGLVISLALLIFSYIPISEFLKNLAYIITILVGISTLIINYPKLKTRFKEFKLTTKKNGKSKSNSR